MSNSDADYTSKLTGKRYRLERAKSGCQGCAFTIQPDEDASRAGKALTKARIADCADSRGCIPSVYGASKVFKEITE